jgi:uncharacterized membrane protein YhhN
VNKKDFSRYKKGYFRKAGNTYPSSKQLLMTVFRKYGTLLFAFLLLTHCLFIYFGMNDLRVLSKLLLIPFLIVYLFAVSVAKPGALAVCGLLFSFAGDLLLTRSGEIFFLLGMLAFIGTHVCNSCLFLKYRDKDGEEDSKIVSTATVIVVTLSIVVYRQTQPYLGSFKWPVVVYMGIISMMTILAMRLINNPAVKKTAVRCIIPGATLFVLSDALLAMNKFRFHEGMLDIAIMLTYGVAQYCLVRGFAKLSPQVKIGLSMQ